MKTSKELQDEITELTAKWYELVGSDHHKDRDCHWYITGKWSYGSPVKYAVEHHGYVWDDVYSEFNTYSEACVFLIRLLNDAIFKTKKEREEME